MTHRNKVAPMNTLNIRYFPMDIAEINSALIPEHSEEADIDIPHFMPYSYRALSNIMRNPVTRVEVKQLMLKAKKVMRGVLALLKLNHCIKMYGTSSGLIGLLGRYKPFVGNGGVLEMSTPHIEEQPIDPESIYKGLLFLPESKFKQIWNLLMLVLLMYVFIGTPWIIAFEDVKVGSPLFFFEASIDFLFFCDIFITLNSAYLQGLQLITSRYKIFKNYATGLLAIDILAIFPFFLFETGGSNSSNGLIRIVRIVKISRIFRASKLLNVIKHLSNSESMERFIKLIRTHDGITRLLTATYIIMIMAHFTACMWYFTAKLDGLGPDTWVVRGGFQDSGNGRLYLAALYWAFTILTTVGFGDIHPFTLGETVLCIF